MRRVKFTAFPPLVPASDSLMILLAAVSLIMLLFRWNSNARSLFCFSRSKIKTVERNFKVLISAIKWGTHNPINQPEFQQNRLKQNFNFYKPIRRGKEMVNLKKNRKRERKKKKQQQQQKEKHAKQPTNNITHKQKQYQCKRFYHTSFFISTWAGHVDFTRQKYRVIR